MNSRNLAILAGTLVWASAQGQTLTVLKSFTYWDGSNPYGKLVLSASTLYGTTSTGGTNNRGTIFKINTNGSGFAVLKQFAPPGPALPLGRLTLLGSTIYGTSRAGGSAGNGTVFKINTDGSGFAILKAFAGTDGAGPYAGLTASGNTLYGTTYNGGTWDNGTVFKINTDGSGFAVLKHFSLDGVNPAGEMVLAGNTLYGTTYNGGLSGSIFKINTDGSGYSVLRTLAYLDGNHPYAGLVLASNTLYGAAYAGGALSGGTLYKININGTGYTVLHVFDSTNGANPSGSISVSGNTIYGTTENGGNGLFGFGTVFKINSDGTRYTVLKDLLATEPAGTSPHAGVTVSGSTLYGTTCYGGAVASGAIFSLTTTASAPTITTQPLNQTNLAGTNASFQVVAAGTPPLSYQWRKDAINLIDSAIISGAHSNVLTLSSIQTPDAGNYTVVITNTAGSITSTLATLTVLVKHPPIAATDSVEVPLGLRLNIPISTLLANDADPDGGTLGISAVQSPSTLGTDVQLANSTITYWAGFDAPTDRFTYTLTNSAGGVATGIVNVTLTGSLPGTNQMIAQPLTGGGLRLIVGGHLTSPYILQRTGELATPITWQSLETNWAGARGYVFFTNTPPPGTPTFYRVHRLW